MHPFIAASLATQWSDEHAHVSRDARPAAARGTPRRVRPTDIVPADLRTKVGPADAFVPDVVIRRATADDAPALVRIGILDGNRPAGQALARAVGDAHGVLVAEVDGTIDAALALDGGLAVANPFRPTTYQLQLLAIRAEQLGGDAPVRRRGWLRVLHPRTS